MRVNLGCGEAYLDGWVNVDSSPQMRSDFCGDAIDFVRHHATDIDEVYMGHLVEHMQYGDALSLLRVLVEWLRPGTPVSAVAPDMRGIFEAYLRGELDNHSLNDRFVYSYEQPSHHMWCHDTASLTALFLEAGFGHVEPVDIPTWEPVRWKSGPESRWQCGVRAVVPAERPRLGTAQANGRGELPPSDTDTDIDIAVDTDSVDHLEAPHPHPATLLMQLRRLRARIATMEAHERRYPNAELAELRYRRQEMDRMDRELAESRQQLQAIERSSPFRAALAASRVVRRVLPAGSRQRRVVGTMARRLRALPRDDATRSAPPPVVTAPPSPEPVDTIAEHGRQRHVARFTNDPIGFRIVVLDGADSAKTDLTVGSLVGQTWKYWQAVVIEPEGSTDAPSAFGDERVRRLRSDHPLRLANAVLDGPPTRDFVIFMQAGDVLDPSCLFETAAAAHRDPLVDLTYWDDILVGANLDAVDAARVRPSWSPETLLSGAYIGTSFAIRHRRFLFADGLRPELAETAMWDLILRAGLDEARVARIPRFLARVIARPDAATAHGVAAVSEHLTRLEWPATARLRDRIVQLEWTLTEWPHVTIVVPTRHNRALLGTVLDGLAGTDHPSFDVVVVDNGERSPDNEQWYRDRASRLPLEVRWWDRPFNYSAVNNAGADGARGDVLVFLNDDTEVVHPAWLRELCGWVTRDGVGIAGLQLIDGAGLIQHGGVVLGVDGGFAGHLFQGLRPGDRSMLGPTGWYRNALSVTGACLAVRREVFRDLGGFDEQLQLCGSDVALGLAARIRGLRNVCSAATAMRHLESATRGSTLIPAGDFHMSFWRYQPWLRGGDPYFSPALAPDGRATRLREEGDPTAMERVSSVLGRRFDTFRQRSDPKEVAWLTGECRVSADDVSAVHVLHEANRAPSAPRTVNWFIPDIDSPFYGGINTAFRIADHLARHHGVVNRFAISGEGPRAHIAAAVAAAFPGLAGSEVHFLAEHGLDQLPPADAAIATLWTTAYQVARFEGARRKFYLVQDFEPIFYPASTMYALAEESYRLGLYGICNTKNLRRIYEERYGGKAMSFMPAVDTSVFHPHGRKLRPPDAPVTLFVYSRPGHWRNCWELASAALNELKERLGDRVRIVAAGSWIPPEETGHLEAIRHLGLLDYRATGALYRGCDLGLALTVSEHPSYLPLELMACGAGVVAFDNPAGHWLLRHEENCLLAPRTVDGLLEALERMVINVPLRNRLVAEAQRCIEVAHSDWDRNLAEVHGFLSDPEGHGQRSPRHDRVSTRLLRPEPTPA